MQSIPSIGPIILVFATAALAGGALAQTAPAPPPIAPPAAAVHQVKLTNAAKTGITAVYVAPSGSRNMSDDLLGRQIANAGKTVTLKVKDPQGTCVFDLQFLMDNGDTLDRKAVDLCHAAEYALTP